MKQQRNTKQRQLVLAAVQARCDHPSADQIYLDVRAIDGKISRGTVYRNLNLLVQNGELCHVKIQNIDRFDCRRDRHHHLVCTRCGAICDAPIAYRKALDQEAAMASGYRIESHSTVFHGLCPDCQAQEAAPPENA